MCPGSYKVKLELVPQTSLGDPGHDRKLGSWSDQVGM